MTQVLQSTTYVESEELPNAPTIVARRSGVAGLGHTDYNGDTKYIR